MCINRRFLAAPGCRYILQRSLSTIIFVQLLIETSPVNFFLKVDLPNALSCFLFPYFKLGVQLSLPTHLIICSALQRGWQSCFKGCPPSLSFFFVCLHFCTHEESITQLHFCAPEELFRFFWTEDVDSVSSVIVFWFLLFPIPPHPGCPIEAVLPTCGWWPPQLRWTCFPTFAFVLQRIHLHCIT